MISIFTHLKILNKETQMRLLFKMMIFNKSCLPADSEIELISHDKAKRW